MTRTIPTALLNALSNAEIEPFYAVDLAFNTANLRMWTGHGNKTINSQTYAGTGNLLSIEGLEEASDLSAKGTTLTLNGLDSTIISRALTEEYQGRLVTIYWGVGGVSDEDAEDPVVEVFSGYMDKMTIQDDGESATIQLTVESRLITLERPNVRRYTSESHASTRLKKWLDAGNSGNPAADTFFDYVTQLQDKQIVWGRAVTNGEETS